MFYTIKIKKGKWWQRKTVTEHKVETMSQVLEIIDNQNKQSRPTDRYRIVVMKLNKKVDLLLDW